MATTINPVNIVIGYDGAKLKAGLEVSRAELNNLKRTISSLVPDTELYKRELEVLDKTYVQLGLDTRGYLAVQESIAAKYGQETLTVRRLREETEKLAAAEKARTDRLDHLYNMINTPGATSSISRHEKEALDAARRRAEYDEKARERARANDAQREADAAEALRRRAEYDEKARERARAADLETERLKTEALRRRVEYDEKARERARVNDAQREQELLAAMRRRNDYDERARERARAAELELERNKMESLRRRTEYDERARERARANDARREQAALAAMRRRHEYDEQARARARANAEQKRQEKLEFGSGLKKAMIGVAGQSAASYASLGAFGLTGMAFAKSVAAASEVEQAAAAYEVLAGSAYKANAIVAQMRELDAKSVLNLGDITQAGKILMGYQISADKVMPTLLKLGDISMGNADKFRSLALAFGQVNAAGRLMGQETLQFINAGFNPLQQIAKDTGRSMPELKKAMEDGQISFEMVERAIINATTAGGLFNGMLEKMSETTEGKWQILLGAFKRAGVELGEQIRPATDLGMDVGTAAGGFLETSIKDVGAIGSALANAYRAITGTLDDHLRTQRALMADETIQKNYDKALAADKAIAERDAKLKEDVDRLAKQIREEDEEERQKQLANAQLISDIREKDYEFIDEAYARQKKDEEESLAKKKKLAEEVLRMTERLDPVSAAAGRFMELNQLQKAGLNPLLADQERSRIAEELADKEMAGNKYGAESAQKGSREEWKILVERDNKKTQVFERQLTAAYKMIQILEQVRDKENVVLANARGTP